jgi:8-oxo-dGTP pyrophosphatase MutT (NUDIX family)
MTPPEIHRVTTIDLKVRQRPWLFAIERREEIEAHFALTRETKPEIWNGRVLIGSNPQFSEDRFTAEYFETDFASFLAWRDWGFPDRTVFNGFGMGALKSSDGAYLLGEMNAHTANAGRIYFPSGTPDPDDVKDGMLDIEGSVVREIEEETGLAPADYTMDAQWHCVSAGARIAMIRILMASLPGEALRARIEANLVRQARPELRAVHLVRHLADLSPAMPHFVTAFLKAQLPAASGRILT